MNPMKTFMKIHVLDAACHRRAAIAAGLLRVGCHAEPYESLEELAAHWPADGIVLFHDEEGAHRDLCDAMARDGVCLPAVAYADAPVPDRIVRLMLDGVSGFLAYPLDFATLPARLAEMAEGTQARRQHALRSNAAQARLARLSAREAQVAAWLARGNSNKEIARALCISPRTVEIHRAHTMEKLGARSIADVVRLALEAELVPQYQAA